MNIRINERAAVVAAGSTVAGIARSHKPGTNVLILNGFPATDLTELHEGCWWRNNSTSSRKACWQQT